VNLPVSRTADTGWPAASRAVTLGSVDGPHDLGGRMDFGAVLVDPREPVFRARWEAAAMVLVSAASARAPNYTLSSFRYAVERMDPVHYLGSPYYEHWLTAAATTAVETGLLSPEQLEKRAGGPFPLAHPPRVHGVENPGTGAARFTAGDRVRVRQWHPLGHTRCPGYLRGHVGTVLRRHGAVSLPDVEVHAPRRVRETVYTVRFDAGEVWGDRQTGVRLNADLWDSYLETP
jgi:nitrile hydratase subunit beta